MDTRFLVPDSGEMIQDLIGDLLGYVFQGISSLGRAKPSSLVRQDAFDWFGHAVRLLMNRMAGLHLAARPRLLPRRRAITHPGRSDGPVAKTKLRFARRAAAPPRNVGPHLK